MFLPDRLLPYHGVSTSLQRDRENVLPRLWLLWLSLLLSLSCRGPLWGSLSSHHEVMLSWLQPLTVGRSEP